MKDQNRKEEANINPCVVLVFGLILLKEENAENESCLDHEHEDRPIEDINLIFGFQSIFIFVLFHEGTI
jgi:hypothetical protein